MQIIKFLWTKFFELWNIQNTTVHGTSEMATNKLKAERYRTIIETMYHLHDQLEATNWQYMFQMLEEVEDF